MRTLKDEGIDVVPVTGGFRYTLPKRGRQPGRTFGWVIAGFGAIGTIFMVFWMSGPIRDFLKDPSRGRWFLLVFGLLGLAGLIPALGALFRGLGEVVGWSHCVVEVTGTRLTLTECRGLIRRSRSRELKDLTGFYLCVPSSARKGDDPMDADGSASEVVGSLEAETDKAKPSSLSIAKGYPPSLLQALARELSERTKLPITDDSDDDEEEPDVVAVEPGEEQAGRQAADREVAERMPKTDIVIQSLPDGVALAVPPAGLWRGTKGLFIFGILWLLFSTGMLVVMIVPAVKEGSGGGPPWPVFGFAGVFVAIGIAMLFCAINMGMRRALIAFSKGVLTIRQIGIFGEREWRFERGDIEDVLMGPSGMSVNDKPVMELRIVPREGEQVGVLSQRSEEELQWVAAVLRESLRGR